MDRAHILHTVKTLISQGSGGEIAVDDLVEGPGSLRNLGLSSLVTLQIMVAVEDEFGIEWEDDVDENVFSDLGLMVDYLADLLGVRA